MYRVQKSNTTFFEMPKFRQKIKGIPIWVKALYQKRDKKKGKLKDKVSKETEKVEKQTTYSELFTEFCWHKKPYLIHKYEIFNDIYHWPPKILQTYKLQLILVLYTI